MDYNEQTVYRLITSIDSNNRTIIGIDGLSRSGKTTLVNKVKEELKDTSVPIQVFHIDDLIVERDKRYNTQYEEWYEYYYLQWDLDWIILNFFDQLKQADQLQLPFYNKEKDTHRTETVDLPKTCIILIEGVFLQRKEWRHYFDYVIYLDVPQQKRFLRESKEAQQDIVKLRNRYWKAEEFYVENELPKKKASMVLDG